MQLILLTTTAFTVVFALSLLLLTAAVLPLSPISMILSSFAIVSAIMLSLYLVVSKLD
jgi:hypothetical protein